METELKNYSIETFKIKYKANEPPPVKDLLNSPERVGSTFRNIIAEFDGGSSVEHFGVFYLNTQNERIGFKVFNTGTVDQVAVYPRLIIHSALMLGASGMILAHNHPSGYTNPSEGDKRLTRSIKDGARLFDIGVLDHLIVGANSHFSFLEKGLI